LGDAIAVLDGDMQDPPELIIQMLEKIKNGADVVYGKRLKRAGETKFKKWTASVYYRFLKKMTDTDIPTDTGDFRIMSRRAVDTMKKIPEHNRYVRGLVSWIGFRQEFVEYNRDARELGETKYPLKKMIKLAADGLLSFSFAPLKLILFLGILFLGLSIVTLIVCAFYVILILIILAITMFFAGIILIALGIVCEYVARMVDEVRARPLYILDSE
jgi:dolichol-phosphate mannosyltransferase